MRPLAQSDFIRLRHYAPRVKRILLPSDCDHFPGHTKQYLFAHSVLEAFATHFRGTPLLPNILVLHTSPVHEADVFYRALPVLFGPQLLEFYLENSLFHREIHGKDGESVDNLRQSLVLLHQSAPRLISLTLDFAFPPPRMRAMVSEVVCQFHHLTSVSASVPLNLETLVHLARLPSLWILNVELEAKLVEEDDLAPLLKIPRKQFFPQLRQVTLAHQSHVIPITAVLRHISSLHIKHVGVWVSGLDRTSYNQVKECIEVIGLRPMYKKVTSVVLNISPDLLPHPDTGTFDEDALLPLIMLQHLTCLELALGCHFSLDNGACHLMARAWPNIEVLKLGPHATQKTSQVTLEALMWFARLCPRLHRLGICIDADIARLDPLFLSSPPGLGHEQTALTLLLVGRSPIADPEPVASFLSDLFPNLQDVEIEWHSEDMLEDDDEWTEETRAEIMAESTFYTRWEDTVVVLVPRFVQVRKQERDEERYTTTTSDEVSGLTMSALFDFVSV